MTTPLPRPSRRPAAWQGYAAVALAAALWGISGALARYLFRTQVDPLLLVHVRMTGSFLLLVATLGWLRPELLRVPPSLRLRVAIWGILGMAAVQFLYFLAIAAAGVATAIFLQYLSPVATALWQAAATRTRPGPALALALGLATGGSGLLVLGGDTVALSPLGLAAGLGAAAAFTFYTLFGRGLMARLSPWTLLTWGLGAGALVWNLVQPPWRAVTQIHDPVLWFYFAYVCTLATVVPFGLYLWGLRRVPPTPAQITAMLEPVVGAAAAWAALGEALAPLQVAGGLLILVAVALAQRPEEP